MHHMYIIYIYISNVLYIWLNDRLPRSASVTFDSKPSVSLDLQLSQELQMLLSTVFKPTITSLQQQQNSSLVICVSAGTYVKKMIPNCANNVYKHRFQKKKH